jgi:putative transposase
LPDRIRSDNGGPFASVGLGGLSRLSVWWMRLNIGLERIAPGHPEQNGSHEQFHSVLKAETTRPPGRHRAAQQRRFARFCSEYNHERPHAALDNDRPARWYQPSTRPLPTRLPPLEYARHLEIRRVASNGCVSWRGDALFLATPLADEDVAFEEVNDGLWTVRFATLALARYDERQRTLQPIAPITAGRSPAAPARACLKKR